MVTAGAPVATQKSRRLTRQSMSPLCLRKVTPMLLDAVELSFEQMPWLRSADTAAMELARAYARQIDGAVESEDRGEITKSLYLGPHLLNCLRELGGSPQSRKAMQSSDPVGGALASIRASLPGGRREDDSENLDSPAS